MRGVYGRASKGWREAMRCPQHDLEYIDVGYGVVACPEPRCQHATTKTALEAEQDRQKRSALKVKVLEKDLQLSVIYGLQCAGYEVMETGKPHGGQKCDACGNILRHPGWQGNSPDITDLFIRGKQWPIGVWLAVELKGSSTPVSEGQQALCDRGGSYICRSWGEVWAAVQSVERTETR